MHQRNHIRELRKRVGMGQQELSVLAGTSPAELVRIERYGHCPGSAVRQKIAAALGVSEAAIWPDLHEEEKAEVPNG
jgi:DNA-binding XRE family transcriptional regulator